MQALIESMEKLSAKERKALAVLLKQKGINLFGIAPIFKRDESEPPLPSFAQQRQWLLWQLDPQGSGYNIVKALRLQGQLDVAALRQALASLLRAHESLRSRFALEGEQVLVRFAEQGQVALSEHSLASADAQAVKAFVEAAGQRPFDLAEGPLLRADLGRINDQEHVLVLSVHHIVGDGASMALIIEDLIRFYVAQGRGLPLDDAPAPIQYADYATWQRQWMDNGERERQLAYWLGQLGGEQPALELPLDRARPPVQSFAGASHSLALPLATTQALQALAQQQGATLFMVLLASFQVLLHRYSRQEDIRVGVPVANRGRVETERMVGMFVNTQVLRAEIDGPLTFRALLDQVRQRTVEAQAHQDLPFEQLVEALQPERSLSRNPVFQVMFNHQSDGVRTVDTQVPGLRVTEVVGDDSSAQVDLALQTFAHEQGLSARFTYATDLFEPATVERLGTHWQQLIEAIVTSPDTAVGLLPLLADGPATLPAATPALAWQTRFAAQVQARGEQVAVCSGEQQLTYAELDRRANHLAWRLLQAGAGPDVLVGVATPRSLDLAVALLAVIKAGAAYVPLDPGFPQERLDYMVSDSGIGILLAPDEVAAQFDGPLQRLGFDEGVRADAPVPVVQAEHLAYVIYTSGSTGRPKGVMVRRAALDNFIESMLQAPGMGAEDRLLSLTTFSFDIFALELFVPLACGAQVVLADKAASLDPQIALALVREHRINVLQATPTSWRMLLDHPDAQALHGCRLLTGGEALSAELAERLSALGAQVWNLYGPTETTIWSARHRLKGGEVVLGEAIGRTTLQAVEDMLHSAPTGVPGELLIGGEGLARGYLRRPGLTAERFVPDPHGVPGARLYRTGDLVRRDNAGQWRFLGRVDHQVKIRGLRIELGEIEASLLAQADIREAAVVVQGGSEAPVLAAYVVPTDGQWLAADGNAQAQWREGLKQRLAERLPEYMVPSFVLFMAALPRTPNDKLDRKALPAPDASQLQRQHVAPVSELECAIAQIWATALKLERVGLSDNFFELGGHSLLVVNVVARLRLELGLNLSPQLMFQFPTLGALAEQLQHQGKALDQASLARLDSLFDELEDF